MEWAGAELERTVAAFDGDQIVGTGRNYSLELTLPGGAIVPASGVSWISVRPTHRRQGILRSMMEYLLDESARREDPVSMLTASEGGIYGRFGFGVATRVLSGDCPTAEVCWLAGDAGQVFVRAAGGTWADRPIADAHVAVVAIKSSSRDAATATLADGRRFSTTDGGRTGRSHSRSLQETSPRPFFQMRAHRPTEEHMASLVFRAGGPVAIAALAGLFVLAPARHDDRIVRASQDQDTSISATLKDQVDLAVTVYNSNIALVRDVRQVALPAARSISACSTSRRR
jgi:hypothetical protein